MGTSFRAVCLGFGCSPKAPISNTDSAIIFFFFLFSCFVAQKQIFPTHESAQTLGFCGGEKSFH